MRDERVSIILLCYDYCFKAQPYESVSAKHTGVTLVNLFISLLIRSFSDGLRATRPKIFRRPTFHKLSFQYRFFDVARSLSGGLSVTKTRYSPFPLSIETPEARVVSCEVVRLHSFPNPSCGGPIVYITEGDFVGCSSQLGCYNRTTPHSELVNALFTLYVE